MEKEDRGMTMEVQCVFKTTLPEQYQIPEVQINISTSSNNKDLTQVSEMKYSYPTLDSKIADRRRRAGQFKGIKEEEI